MPSTKYLIKNICGSGYLTQVFGKLFTKTMSKCNILWDKRIRIFSIRNIIHLCITHTPFNECHYIMLCTLLYYTVFCWYLPKNRINLQNRCLNNRKYTAIILYLVVHGSRTNNNNSIKCIVVSNWIYPFGALWGPDGTPRYNSMSPSG